MERRDRGGSEARESTSARREGLEKEEVALYSGPEGPGVAPTVRDRRKRVQREQRQDNTMDVAEALA